ncbi:hypothetical protein L5515_012382 [Caenorhabditis briggsae]|uniref:Uncharacterized protein n=1 Tax=Caenorhabditis briggsae TaxID=6238 RepID=A0AAE9EVT1_CAEBR|nr:hypothetical protein L5515_012382 [Caenorhabditis briggsae]
MDRYITRQKRKSPDSDDSSEKKTKTNDEKWLGKSKNLKGKPEKNARKIAHPRENKAEQSEKPKERKMDEFVRKEEKKPEKKEKKPEKSPKKTAKKVEKLEKSKAENPEKSLKIEIQNGDQLPESVNSLSDLLPTLSNDKGKTISDEDFRKLFHALCPNVDKLYDSDDSIISEIDFMDAEQLAADTARCREAMEYIANLPNKVQAVNAILNQGNETKEEREERRRVIREIKSGLKTKEEKEQAERQIQKKNKALRARLEIEVHVFEKDQKKASDADLPLITCRQFASLLGVMVEFAPEAKKSDLEAGTVDFRAQIDEIDEEAMEKKLKFGPKRSAFYTRNKTITEYLKLKVRQFFKSEDIFDVLNGERYGFEFSTKECLQVLVTYFTSNKPKRDDGSSAKPLAINIKKLVASAYYTTRSAKKEIPINEALRMALFD